VSRHIKDYVKRKLEGEGENSLKARMTALSNGAAAPPAVEVKKRLSDSQADDSVLLLLPHQIEVRQQVRTHFDPESLQELADSIRDEQQADPVTVRPLGQERYLLVAGERRLRAIRLHNERYPDDLRAVRATLREDLTDESHDLFQLAENIHNQSLRPIEEAQAIRKLMIEHHWNQKTVGERLHKSKAWVSKRLTLLEADVETQAKVERGELSAHAAVEASRQGEGAAPAKENKPRAATVAIDARLAHRLCKRLVVLAEQLDMEPIMLKSRPTRKELMEIINNRALGILDALNAPE
jgi:ParB family chromosome partitioning protein